MVSYYNNLSLLYIFIKKYVYIKIVLFLICLYKWVWFFNEIKKKLNKKLIGFKKLSFIDESGWYFFYEMLFFLYIMVYIYIIYVIVDFS